MYPTYSTKVPKCVSFMAEMFLAVTAPLEQKKQSNPERDAKRAKLGYTKDEAFRPTNPITK